MVQAMTLNDFIEEWKSDSPTVAVKTSGSTGPPKSLLVEKKRMADSARLTCDFLGLRSGDTALLCLPLDYIAGKMMVVRALIRGLELMVAEPSGNPLRGLSEPPFFAAMIPLQVFNSLRVPEERKILEGIGNLIIGGGPVDEAMAMELKSFPNAVWSTYGMTETLSHIALRRLSGESAEPWYRPLDSVVVSVDPGGHIVVKAPKVCPDVLVTNDLGEMSPDGRGFRLIGRAGNVINSGGIKIQIEDIEERLKPFIDHPFAITKKKDEKLGESVVMVLGARCGRGSTHENAAPSCQEEVDEKNIKEICDKILPVYCRPRLYIKVKELPMTVTGKTDRAEVLKIADNYHYLCR